VIPVAESAILARLSAALAPGSVLVGSFDDVDLTDDGSGPVIGQIRLERINTLQNVRGSAARILWTKRSLLCARGAGAESGRMSHFTTVATRINDLACLLKALDKLKMNYTHAEEGVTVRGWRGQTSKAEVCINMGRYDIGVVKNADGTYGLEADWWGIETTVGKTEQEVVEELNREYAYQKVLVTCESQGYRIEDTTVAEDGTIKLSVAKWS